MSIKKIKNLKYSESRNQEEIKWVEAISKRNRLLVESDWTQLPDVNLTQKCKNQWEFWRGRVRSLSRLGYDNDFKKFKTELDDLERERGFIDISYISSSISSDIESGRKFLYQLLISLYEEKVSHMFTPNLEDKYQETLDIISIILSNMNTVDNLDKFDVETLIKFIQELNEIEMDISKYPFFELTQQVKNLSIRDTILYILSTKKKQYDFSLQEEYYLIHYENRIKSCVTDRDLLNAKREIEMYYGH